MLILIGSVAKLWTNFCWVMGPLLLHNKTIKLMDSVIHSVAAKRYESDMETAHKILAEYFEKQPDSFSDKKNKEIWWGLIDRKETNKLIWLFDFLIPSFNTRKIIELPYHSYKTDKKEFETSKYLTNLTWLHNKIKSTGCVQFLLDIYLTNPPQPQSPSSKLSGHLQFLLTFIQTHFEALNYDAQQIYSLLSTYIKHAAQLNKDNANNSIVKSWLKEIQDQNILTIEKIEFEHEETMSGAEDAAENADGYDQLINTNNKNGENFIISVHTAREEICVWDVIKWVLFSSVKKSIFSLIELSPLCRGKKVRTLKGVPQPSSVCPVGEFKLAVLCKREIRVLDLNEGVFKVRPNTDFLSIESRRVSIMLKITTEKKHHFRWLSRV